MMEKESILLAARGCYYPIHDMEKQCMAWVIECLVMPKDKMKGSGYTQEEMESYITSALMNAGMEVK